MEAHPICTPAAVCKAILAPSELGRQVSLDTLTLHDGSERLRETHHTTHPSDEIQRMPYTLGTQEAESRATTASWQRSPPQVLQAPSEPKTKFTG